MRNIYKYIAIFGVLLLLIITNSQMNFKLKLDIGEKQFDGESSIGQDLNGTISNNLVKRLNNRNNSNNNSNNDNNNRNNRNNRNNMDNMMNNSNSNNRNNRNNQNNSRENKNVLLDNKNYSRFYWDNSFKR